MPPKGYLNGSEGDPPKVHFLVSKKAFAGFPVSGLCRGSGGLQLLLTQSKQQRKQTRTIAIASDFRVDGAKSPERPQKEWVLGLEIAARNRRSLHCFVLSRTWLAISGVRDGHDDSRKSQKSLRFRCAKQSKHQEPLNGPFLNALFSGGFSRRKMAHSGTQGNGRLRSENGPLRRGNAPLRPTGCFLAPCNGEKQPL